MGSYFELNPAKRLVSLLSADLFTVLIYKQSPPFGAKICSDIFLPTLSVLRGNEISGD